MTGDQKRSEKIMVVDLGFSAAKFLCGDKRGIVKSCFRKTRDGEGYSFCGDNYLIGERALLQTGSHFLRTTEELIAYYPLFVGVAAERSQLDHGDLLAVGLPFDCWKTESSKQKRGACNAIDGLAASLRLIPFNKGELSFERVIVYPQGLGGIKAYLASSQSTGGNILAIDIGFNTVISTLYSQADHEILAGRTFYKKGLHDMAVNLLMPDIASHIGGKTLTPLEINHIMQTGSIQVGFDLIDIRPEIDAAIDVYVKDLLDMIVGDLKAHGGVITFDTLLLFGGGARLLRDRLEAKKVNIVVLPEPEFANARGFQIRAAAEADSMVGSD